MPEPESLELGDGTGNPVGEDAPTGYQMYDELAEWWPLLSPPEDYAEEAGFFGSVLSPPDDSAGRPTMIELGSGGGNNASFLKHHFDLTLVDPSPGMLAHSRALNPECEHLSGDMRTLRLERLFDRVFVHDAVCYMTTREDLLRAMETAFAHCRPGGLALFAPDYVRETFGESTDDGGASARDGRGLRYLEWVHDPDPADTMYTVDYAYMLRTADGAVRVEHDRHVEGLFSRDTWIDLLRRCGFEPRVVPFVHSEVDRVLDVFVGHRPER